MYNWEENSFLYAPGFVFTCPVASQYGRRIANFITIKYNVNS